MKVWFMYDNHETAKVGEWLTTSRAAMEAKARECFAEDGCGALSAYDWQGHRAARLNGRRLTDRYGVTDAELAAFFDRVDEYANWEAR